MEETGDGRREVRAFSRKKIFGNWLNEISFINPI